MDWLTGLLPTLNTNFHVFPQWICVILEIFVNFVISGACECLRIILRRKISVKAGTYHKLNLNCFKFIINRLASPCFTRISCFSCFLGNIYGLLFISCCGNISCLIKVQLSSDWRLLDEVEFKWSYL